MGARAAAMQEMLAPAPLRRATPLLAIEDLCVVIPRYRLEPQQVLRGIDLEMAPGEVLGLVGESGSGKTMLARGIMQLIPPPGRIERGHIRFDGQDLGALDEEALRRLRGRDIAMIIANPRGELDPLQTVGEQIGAVLRYHLRMDRAAIRARVLELLRRVSIPDPERRIEAYPHELSGGMAQRVVMGVALACSPKFIISDDATSGLDVTVQAQVLELMRQLVVERGTSLLFITRDIAITAHFCDRVAVIYAGEIMELAPRDEFFENPQHPYTLLLLAAFSHNERLRRYWLGEDEARKDMAPSPTGCAFANRCVRAQPRCRGEHPSLRELGPGHFVRCHFPVER
jgi:oligopeptide/dipeptide ABC transporter ATP-binding protein